MFKNILIPTDGSKIATSAAERAIELAKSMKARVHVISVSPTHKQLTSEGFILPEYSVGKSEWDKGVRAKAQTVLDAVAAKARSAGVACTTAHVFRDQAYTAIVDAAKKVRCDLIVMGSHGYGGIKQLLLGSETMRVLQNSKVPVLVYR